MSIELKITDRTNVAFPIVIKDKNGNVIYCQFESGYWYESTYDEKGNELTYKDSNGYWCEKTYNDNSNVLTYKNSKGFWYECTYNEKGKELTCKDSDGNYKIKGEYVTKQEFELFLNNN
jgi:hypothetical protein